MLWRGKVYFPLILTHIVDVDSLLIIWPTRLTLKDKDIKAIKDGVRFYVVGKFNITTYCVVSLGLVFKLFLKLRLQWYKFIVESYRLQPWSKGIQTRQFYKV